MVILSSLSCAYWFSVYLIWRNIFLLGLQGIWGVFSAESNTINRYTIKYKREEMGGLDRPFQVLLKPTNHKKMNSEYIGIKIWKNMKDYVIMKSVIYKMSLKIGRNGPMLSIYWKIIIPRNVYPNKLYVKYNVKDLFTNEDIYVTHSPCIFSQKVPRYLSPNYHIIALISLTSKVMLKFLQASLQQYLNRELPDVQADFRKDRGTRDQIANICWIIEKAREFH